MSSLAATSLARLPDADAFVVGSGPNGLAAAIVLARAGLKSVVVEQADSIGGGCRSAALTLPGYVHDVCSAIHPLAVSSPFFRALDLARFGLTWIHPTSPLAHPFDDGTAVILERSVAETAATLGADAGAYGRLMGPLVERWDDVAEDILAPVHLPRHPLALGRFGLSAARSATGLADHWFEGPRARGLIAGLAAHSFLPLEHSPSGAFALVLGLTAHAAGWPLPQGGAARLSSALAKCLEHLGGRIVRECRVDSLRQLAPARIMLLDVTPRQLLRLAGDRLGARCRRQLQRYRYGPGVFKVDWALAGSIPWRARECLHAGTVHLGATLEEIAAAEREVALGQHPKRPFVLLAQQSLFDATRAPAGRHTGWAYCHVPHGSACDMTERIEQQVERFAPGFRDLILARHTRTAAALEAYNPNCIGGDINGGAMDWRQLLFRPTARLIPYATDTPGLFICSSSTPPGGGVHGMCGYHAARAALRRSKMS